MAESKTKEAEAEKTDEPAPPEANPWTTLFADARTATEVRVGPLKGAKGTVLYASTSGDQEDKVLASFKSDEDAAAFLAAFKGHNDARTGNV